MTRNIFIKQPDLKVNGIETAETCEIPIDCDYNEEEGGKEAFQT